MGLLAGVVFMVFEMVVAGIMDSNPFAPPRMISAIALGQEALPMMPMIGLGIALPVAMLIHFVLSAIYGGVFGAIAANVQILQNRLALIGAATIFGVLLWIVNFYIIAPVAFPWFLMANQVVQFVAHTFFFGSAVGLLLAWARQERREQRTGVLR
jgi:signal transduction histidine kinase